MEIDKGLIIPGDSTNSSIQLMSSKEWMASSTKARSSRADLLFKIFSPAALSAEVIYNQIRSSVKQTEEC